MDGFALAGNGGCWKASFTANSDSSWNLATSVDIKQAHGMVFVSGYIKKITQVECHNGRFCSHADAGPPHSHASGDHPDIGVKAGKSGSSETWLINTAQYYIQG